MMLPTIKDATDRLRFLNKHRRVRLQVAPFVEPEYTFVTFLKSQSSF